MTTNEWLDPAFVERWTAADTLAEFLGAPRQISAIIVAQDRPQTRLVLDIGSGPGDYLATMLEAFPRANGVWSDVSQAMVDTAQNSLARLADRVSFQVADMVDLSPLPSCVDVIVTSRATHHLDPAALARFYADAGRHLAPGGWLVNLDHVGLPEAWDARLRGARRILIPPSSTPSHHHTIALPSARDHLTGLAEAGFDDVDTPWRGLFTCLFMARRGD